MPRKISLSVALLLCMSVSQVHPQAQIADGIYFLAGGFPPNGQPDGNSVLMLGPEGFLVIDTGRHAAHAQAIVDFIDREKRPLLAVVNTHWHLDHIGGNAALGKLNPLLQVFASSALDGALSGFLKDYKHQLEQLIAEAKGNTAAWRTELALLNSADKLRPNRIISSSFEMQMVGRPLRLNLEHAATAGDVWIEDVTTRTVVAGDLVTLPVPLFDTACPEKWEATLNRMSAKPFELLIPGHGSPMNKRSFDSYRAGFARLLRCSESQRTSDECARDWQRDIGTLMSPRDSQRAAAMLDYYFKTVLRSPKRAELCRAR